MTLCPIRPVPKFCSCNMSCQHNCQFLSLILPILIFASSVATFTLSMKYLDILSTARLTTYAIALERLWPSHFRLGFYTVALSFLSLFQSLFVLVVHHLWQPISAIATICVCATFSLGWLAQWMIWMSCEVTTLGLSGGACPQRDLNLDTQRELTVARLACGGLIFVLYVLGFGLAWRSLYKERQRRKFKGECRTNMVKWVH